MLIYHLRQICHMLIHNDTDQEFNPIMVDEFLFGKWTGARSAGEARVRGNSEFGDVKTQVGLNYKGVLRLMGK
jgi:hypothetical protein